MKRQTLRGKHNEIIGYLEDRQEDIILRDGHNVIAGRYCKTKDRTYDAHGGIVSASGNTLLVLLCRI